MFSGIVRSLGEVMEVHAEGGDLRLALRFAEPFDATPGVGASVAVNGACLTAVEIDAAGFAADVSAETLACTTLGELRVGDKVNLEPALRMDGALDGHLLSGHVDGVGSLLRSSAEARSTRFEFEAPASLMRYIAVKGSIAVDGVSLTVNEVEATRFGVNIVPHTQSATCFQYYQAGARVNLEVDMIARYLERLLADRNA